MIRRALALMLLVGLGAVIVPLTGIQQAGSAPSMIVGRVHETYQPNKGKIFVLVIGSDARRGNPDRAMADAIHVVGVNAKTMRGGILNFPRDSWVNIPGYGHAKINEALFAGGPDLLARTIENLTGIRLDYWVLVGFEDFQAIISKLGGVKVHVPVDLYDPGGSGAALEAGTQKLKSWEALQLARTRHGFVDGDLSRTANQARLLLALLRKLRGEIADNPASLLRWMAVTRAHARLDMGGEEMFRLGILASQMHPDDVGNVTVPVSLGWMGPQSVAFVSPRATAIYERFKSAGSL